MYTWSEHEHGMCKSESCIHCLKAEVERLRMLPDFQEQNVNLVRDNADLRKEVERLREADKEAGGGIISWSQHYQVVHDNTDLREENAALRKRVAQLEEWPHKNSDDCPTYYDGCHCAEALDLISALIKAGDAMRDFILAGGKYVHPDGQVEEMNPQPFIDNYDKAKGGE